MSSDTDHNKPWESDDEDGCVVHPVSFDDTCEFCETELSKKLARYKQISSITERKVKELNAYGGRIDTNSLVEMKLDMLISVLFREPDGKKQRTNFELVYASEVLGVVESALAEIMKARLLQGNAPQSIQIARGR